jgi:hypothetical protein
MGNPWKLREPVMLYAQPTSLDLCARIEVMKMLAAGETVDACIKHVEQHTEPRVREIEECFARARSYEDTALEAMTHYRREASRLTNELIEIRQWILLPVVEHMMLQPSPPICIPLSEWESWQKKGEG